MRATDRGVLSDMLYVPKHTLKGREDLLKQFTYHIKNAEGEPEIKRGYLVSRRYIGFHRGDRKKIIKLFGWSKPLCKMASVPMSARLEFTSTLYAEQLQCMHKWMEQRHGILVAPTGWGKTVCSLAILCELQLRTLILVAQTDHARMWMDEMYRHTNLEQLEMVHKERICGIYSTKKRRVYPSITVATYQSFIHKKSSAWWKDNRDRWGAVFVDEADQCGATTYSQIVGGSTAVIRGGATATPKRNDGLENMVYDVIGPVTAVGVIPNMSAIVTMVSTGITVPAFPGMGGRNGERARALTWLEKNDKFYDMIKRMIIKDAENGRYILLASDRNTILKQLAADLEEHPSLTGKVALLIGPVPQDAREEIKRRARLGEITITLAQTTICMRALNVSRWDCLYRITPCAGWTRGTGAKSPNSRITQPLGRILRKARGFKKPTPIVRHFTFDGTLVGSGKTSMTAYQYLRHTVVQRTYGELLAYGDE